MEDEIEDGEGSGEGANPCLPLAQPPADDGKRFYALDVSVYNLCFFSKEEGRGPGRGAIGIAPWLDAGRMTGSAPTRWTFWFC